MKKFEYLEKKLDIGNQIAERDWPNLKENFIEISTASFVGEGNPAIIIGRKGSGKTALRLHFQKFPGVRKRVVYIEPSYQDLVKSFEYLIEIEKRSFSTEFISQLWEATAYIKLCKASLQKTRKLDAYPELSALPHEAVEDILSEERFGIGRTLDMIAAYFPSPNERARFIRLLREFLRRQIVNTDTEFYLLIDSVDEILHNTIDATSRNDLFSTFFEGLWAFYKAFQNVERNDLASRIHIQIFVPIDIYSWSIGRHADHIRQYKHYISWTSAELEEFILLRLMHNLTGGEQRRLLKQEKKDRNNAIWTAFFPPTVISKSYLPSGPLEYPVPFREHAIGMTLRRPRDLQEIVKQVYDCTTAAKQNFPTEDILQLSFQKYSFEMKESVQNEYGTVLPQIADILSNFSGNGTIMNANTVSDLVGKAVGQDRKSIERAMRILFEACVIGAVRNGQTSAREVSFYYDIEDFSLFWGKSKYYAIHRAFWHSLQLQPLTRGIDGL